MAKGLSPRVRGNQVPRNGKRAGKGSIPACAGEPTFWNLPLAHYRVYPRVCGGTFQRKMKAATKGGLSPRVRGNQFGDTG